MEIERKKRFSKEELDQRHSYYLSNMCPDCGGDLDGDGYTEVQHCASITERTQIYFTPDDAPVFCEDERLTNDWVADQPYASWLDDDHWEKAAKLINDRKERNWDVMTKNLHFDLKDYAWS